MKMPFCVCVYEHNETYTRLFIGVPITHPLVREGIEHLEQIASKNKMRVQSVSEKIPIDDKEKQKELSWLRWLVLEPMQHRQETKNNYALYLQVRRRLQSTLKVFKKLIGTDEIVTASTLLEYQKGNNNV
jgi:hypothetical protein